jgi:glycosyltransferase involved in cell wall biosynthesis
MLGKAPSLMQATLDSLRRKIEEVGLDLPSLHLAGAGSRPAWAGESRDYGYIGTEDGRARFWKSTDIALLATEIDNFPNVNLEAATCGAFPISCRVGGAAEAIDAMGWGTAVPATALDLSRAVYERVLEAHASTSSQANSGPLRAAWLYGSEQVGEQWRAEYQKVLLRTEVPRE